MKNKNKKFLLTLLVTNIITLFLAGSMGTILGRKYLVGFGKPPKENQKVIELENIVRENYLRDVDDEDFLRGKLKGVVAALEDPYSSYLTEEEFKSLLEETGGSFGGIGVVVSIDIKNNLIEVVSPIKDTPGERAGLKSGDKILEVNGKKFLGEEMDKAVKEMKGEPGTDVEIKVLRNYGQENYEELDFNIKREEIRVETVSSDLIGDLGYIRITSFDQPTFNDFINEMENLVDRNIKGLIIDLRGNPGGLLDVTANIADLFLEKGDIVYTESKDGSREYIKAKEKKYNHPLVVLVDEGSASASEILSGALKDRGRATIVGKKTFGKGVVQRIIDLGDGTGLKLTISEYFTPGESKIDGVGIEPDIEVDLPEGIKDIGPDNIGEDLQLKKAIELLNK